MSKGKATPQKHVSFSNESHKKINIFSEVGVNTHSAKDRSINVITEFKSFDRHKNSIDIGPKIDGNVE